MWAEWRIRGDQRGLLGSRKRSQRSTASRPSAAWNSLARVLTDPIQHLKRVLGECEFNRREIVLKLVEAFHAKSLDEAAPRRGNVENRVKDANGARIVRKR
jgi:hypothetical protein